MAKRFLALFFVLFSASTVFLLFGEDEAVLATEEELNSMRDELTEAIRSRIRPLTALQIERAREEGVEITPLISIVSGQQLQSSSEQSSDSPSRPVSTSKPTATPGRPTISSPSTPAKPSKPVSSGVSVSANKPVTPNKPAASSRPSGGILKPSAPSRPGAMSSGGRRSVGMDDETRDIDEDDLKVVVLPTNLQGLNLPPDINTPGVVPRYEADIDGAENLSGNLIYANLTASRVSFNALANLNLTIYNVTLNMARYDTALIRNQHTLNVIGWNNRIVIARKLTIDGDGVNSGIFFAHGARLTFEFLNDGSVTPELYLSPNFVMNLSPNAELVFRGQGIVRIGDGCVINLQGEREEKIVNRQKIVTISNRPTICVDNDATLTVEEDAVARINGIGRFVIWGGRLLLNLLSQLIFGHTTTDDFEFLILYGGSINLGSSNSSLVNAAILSFAYATFAVELWGGGAISIDDGGRFEINQINGAIARGILASLTINSVCNFDIFGTGRLSLASNIYDPTRVKPNGKIMEKTVNLLARHGSYKGDGVIEYVGLSPDSTIDRSFSGIFQPTNFEIDNSDQELEELAKALVQTGSLTDGSILFTGLDGNTYARTPNTDQTYLYATA